MRNPQTLFSIALFITITFSSMHASRWIHTVNMAKFRGNGSPELFVDAEMIINGWNCTYWANLEHHYTTRDQIASLIEEISEEMDEYLCRKGHKNHPEHEMILTIRGDRIPPQDLLRKLPQNLFNNHQHFMVIITGPVTTEMMVATCTELETIFTQASSQQYTGSRNFTLIIKEWSIGEEGKNALIAALNKLPQTSRLLLLLSPDDEGYLSEIKANVVRCFENEDYLDNPAHHHRSFEYTPGEDENRSIRPSTEHGWLP